MNSVSKKVKGAIALTAGIVVSVGSSYLYRLGKIYFELDVPSLTEKLIFLMILLPVGFGIAYFLNAFEKT